jgi:hypothetical protein
MAAVPEIQHQRAIQTTTKFRSTRNAQTSDFNVGTCMYTQQQYSVPCLSASLYFPKQHHHRPLHRVNLHSNIAPISPAPRVCDHGSRSSLSPTSPPAHPRNQTTTGGTPAARGRVLGGRATLCTLGHPHNPKQVARLQTHVPGVRRRSSHAD